MDKHHRRNKIQQFQSVWSVDISYIFSSKIGAVHLCFWIKITIERIVTCPFLLPASRGRTISPIHQPGSSSQFIRKMSPGNRSSSSIRFLWYLERAIMFHILMIEMIWIIIITVWMVKIKEASRKKTTFHIVFFYYCNLSGRTNKNRLNLTKIGQGTIHLMK